MQKKYIVSVLNDSNEWELMDLQVFATAEQAEQFAKQLVDEYAYADWRIVEV